MIGFYRVCVIDQILPHSPADYVRRPLVPPESPTLGLSHLQFEAIITTARVSANINDFALVAMLGLLGLRIFEACGANIADLGEEHGHRVFEVRGKGGKVVLVPLLPAVARAIDRAVDERDDGPVLRIARTRMDRHAATRRLKHLAETADLRIPKMHPHMLHHTFVTTMLDADEIRPPPGTSGQGAEHMSDCGATGGAAIRTVPLSVGHRRPVARLVICSRLVRCLPSESDRASRPAGGCRFRVWSRPRRPQLVIVVGD
ncbi:tyrosine-type recombinase/integrase [Actinoplanes sp. NPDC023801]|uniref:tyrosine-type recombinase/integrase n=1 Tax=Actinoplanes sp. NPDC023801 TaxID=3154595 RepID=UPI0033E4197D